MPAQKPRPAGSQHSHKHASLPARHQVVSAKPRLLVLGLMAVLALAGLVGLGAAQFENRDPFCASCHTQPETVYYQREANTLAVDLASFHTAKQTRCIDCHSGSGPTGRVGALALGARDLLAFASGHYRQPSPQTRPIGDSNCLKCHADLQARQDFNNHFHVFLPRWQALDTHAAGCVDCHQSHTTNGDASLGYLNQQVTTQVCQRCHNFAGQGPGS
ncbi:MAG TPA: cytochrome c3 family protein [Anaerolineales bacterium]